MSRDIEHLKKQIHFPSFLSGKLSLTQKGGEYWAKCPFHKNGEERTPSFSVSKKEGNWVWYCHACGKGGDILTFLQEYEKISFSQAVEKLEKYIQWNTKKVEVDSTFHKIAKHHKNVSITLDKLRNAELALEKNPEAIAWLDSRGISLSTAKKFHLGYVQSCKLINPSHEWVDEGWIVFPYIRKENVIFVKYRSIKGKETPGGEKGFLTIPGMSPYVYNVDCIEPFEDIFLVEGEPDTLVMSEAGYLTIGLPSAGYNIPPEVRDSFVNINALYLAGDMDNAGQQAMQKLWSELKDKTYRLEWPAGCKDANDCLIKYCNRDYGKFRQYVEEAKQKAVSSPVPFVYGLRDTILTSDTTSPLDNPARLRFPWSNIDKWTAILPGDVMFLFATESGTGKTSWLMQVLLHNAMQGKTVVNYSAELLPSQYSRRAVAHLVKKNRDELTKEDFILAASLLENAAFYNGYKPGANYKDVIELLRWAKIRLGADILAIDHIHFLTRSEKDEIKAQSEAMRAIKDLAVDLNCIMIVVGQPRKALLSQRGKRVTLYDAKGTEAIASDSSQVFILHRKRLNSDGDSEDKPILDPVTEVVLDKSRESEPQETKLFFNGRICTFTKYLSEEEPLIEENWEV